MAKSVLGFDYESDVKDVFEDEVLNKIKRLRWCKEVHEEVISSMLDVSSQYWTLEGGVSFEINVRRGAPSPRDMAKMLKVVEKTFKDYEYPDKLKVIITSPDGDELSLREYAKLDTSGDMEGLSIYVEFELKGSFGFDGGALGDMQHDQYYDK